MKSIYLYDILKVIEGVLIKGNLNTIVQDVAYALWGVKKDNTMYIHKSKNSIKQLDSLNKFKNMVIVTEMPEFFSKLGKNVSIIKVDDINETYWKFVNYYRGLFDIPIIGITGTCGKTTTTEIIKHMLSKRYNICSTYNGKNATAYDFSYLLQIDDTTEAAVFEMAVIYPNDLKFTCKHFKPQIRILLNIGVYHILGCKTLEGYINAKSELLENLDPVNGVLILNSDDENIKKIDVSKFKQIIYFGISENTEFKASDIKPNGGTITFVLEHKNKTYEVYLPGLGKHNAYNAMAAIAAVSKVGIGINEAIEYLKTYKPMIGHLELKKGNSGCTILDDNWNNTPTSMSSALEVLKEIGESKLKIAVFGSMPNLGTGSVEDEQYSKMGEKVVEVGVDILVIIGDAPKRIGSRAIEFGMAKDKVIFINNGDEVKNILRSYLNEDSILLIKGCKNKISV